MSILSSDEQERVTHAISQAENRTSGEIRVVVENIVGKGEALDKAAAYFEQLEMHKTVLRNGVLIYLAIADHQFAIIGDKGINSKVEEDFWECTKDKMLSHFRQGNFAQGLIEGILQAGEKLRTHFPRQEDDVNELPNDIYFGNN